MKYPILSVFNFTLVMPRENISVVILNCLTYAVRWQIREIYAFGNPSLLSAGECHVGGFM